MTRLAIVAIRVGLMALTAFGTSLIATSAIHAARVATGPESGSQRAPAIDDGELAKLVRFRIEKQRRAMSAVVGVTRPSGRSIIAYQSKRGSHAVEPGGDTIFEIASLTKIFTALLLADAVTRGDVKLDDPLSAFVPTGVKVPEFSGRAITLADLATHTSGLPLRPNNLNAAPDAPNKYAGYTLNQLYAGLPEYRLARAPGSQFEYSNLAFALLGHALARQAGEPFSDLLRRRVTAPLGLTDTRFDDDRMSALMMRRPRYAKVRIPRLRENSCPMATPVRRSGSSPPTDTLPQSIAKSSWQTERRAPSICAIHFWSIAHSLIVGNSRASWLNRPCYRMVSSIRRCRPHRFRSPFVRLVGCRYKM